MVLVSHMVHSLDMADRRVHELRTALAFQPDTGHVSLPPRDMGSERVQRGRRARGLRMERASRQSPGMGVERAPALGMECASRLGRSTVLVFLGLW